VGHGMDKRAFFIEDIGDERHDAVDLLPAVGKAFQKDRHVVVGVLPRVAARPRSRTAPPARCGRRRACRVRRESASGSDRRQERRAFDYDITHCRVPARPCGAGADQVALELGQPAVLGALTRLPRLRWGAACVQRAHAVMQQEALHSRRSVLIMKLCNCSALTVRRTRHRAAAIVQLEGECLLQTRCRSSVGRF
jgi:hypothetical protein